MILSNLGDKVIKREWGFLSDTCKVLGQVLRMGIDDVRQPLIPYISRPLLEQRASYRIRPLLFRHELSTFCGRTQRNAPRGAYPLAQSLFSNLCWHIIETSSLVELYTEEQRTYLGVIAWDVHLSHSVFSVTVQI